MIAELLQLGEMAFKLAGHKRTFDKEYFDSFIEPTWELFKQIHENFIYRITNYIEMTSDTNTSMSTIIKKAQNDALIYASLRGDLKAISINIPAIRLRATDKYLDIFLESLRDYFVSSSVIAQDDKLLTMLLDEHKKADEVLSKRKEVINKRQRGILRREKKRFVKPYNMATVIRISDMVDDTERSKHKEIMIAYKAIFQKRYESVGEAYFAIRRELLA